MRFETREQWAAEVLQREVAKLQEATAGGRNRALFLATCRVSSYVSDGTLPEETAGRTLHDAARALGLEEKETRDTVRSGIRRRQAVDAWYPEHLRGGGAFSSALPSGQKRRKRRPAVTDLPTTIAPPAVRFTLYDRMNATRGEAAEWTWDEIEAAVAQPLDEYHRPTCPLWSCSELEGDDRSVRNKGTPEQRQAEVYKVHGLMLDYDDEPAWSVDQAGAWWADVQHVAYTTGHHNVPKSDKPAGPRGRVLLALSRPVDPDEHLRLAEWALFCGRGRMGEEEIRDTRRSYFLPARTEHYAWGSNLNGRALDVDELFARLDAAEEAAAAEDGQEVDPLEVAKSIAPIGARDPDVWEALAIKVDKEGNERALPTVANAVVILTADPRLRGRIGHDLLAAENQLDRKALSDPMVTAIGCWIARVYGIALSSAVVHDAVGAVANAFSFDPAVEWADALPEWDGKPRLHGLFTEYFGVDPGEGEAELVAEYGVCFPIAAMARIYRPGCQVDSVPILTGLKGLRKSTGWAAFAPRREWFSDSPIEIGEKDGMQSLAGSIVWELAELESVTRRELGQVKAFITSKVDKFRPSYGRCDVRRPRRCVFVGTVNSDSEPTFLREPDRRWWVMHCVRMVDTDALVRDHAQLWAEARWRFLKDEPWHLADERLTAAQDTSVRAYVASDVWEPLVRDYVDGRGKWSAVAAKSEVTTTELLGSAVGLNVALTGKAEENRVGSVMRAIGWQHVRPMVNGVRQHKWRRPSRVQP